ncbi:hypothetical protein RhiJN_03570 [Ceratobasidium sp. AG-Ba]|nr:hypothetical protein RhiJN_03570 [Ceratobasidium sp. AG-Ba]
MNNLIHLGFNFVLGKLYTNTLLATLNSREIEPENVVHVESGSYRLGDVNRAQGANTIKFARPAGLSSQHDLNNGIHLQTDTQVQVADFDSIEPQRRQKMVVLPGESRDEEYDLDGAESVDSKKPSRAL